LEKQNKHPLFFTDPVPLTTSLSEKMRISTPDTYLFAAKTNSVPLASTEFELGCRNYPIVFSSQAPSLPIAILGFDHEENLFVESDGHWMAGTYVPAYVRKFPFIFSENTEEDVFTLCVDSSCLTEEDGTQIYESGKPSKTVEAAIDFSKSFQAAWSESEEFVRVLNQHELLVEKEANIENLSGEKSSQVGFKVIDKDKFNALIASGNVPDLLSPAVLSGVYAHFVSMNNYQTLLDIKQSHS
jgi:hypothetical protein